MKYDKIISAFTSFAKKEDNIRGAIIIGSRARSLEPADEYSDLDILVFAFQTDKLIAETDWLSEIEDHHITFIENLPIGSGKERRVMFSGGLDVDFAILPVVYSKEIISSDEIKTTIQKGVRVLLDKDSLFQDIESLCSYKKSDQKKMPSSKAFDNIINDFWYHCIWSLKKILRGELWTAKMCVDNYMKYLLLRMIEIYSENDGEMVWHNGRFLEKWTKTEIIKLLENCFAHYNKKDIIHALKSTMNLFSVLARKNAKKLKYIYPDKAEEFVWQWIDEMNL
jgi:aminoglycoside 6-adenylyltransferase